MSAPEGIDYNNDNYVMQLWQLSIFTPGWIQYVARYDNQPGIPNSWGIFIA